MQHLDLQQLRCPMALISLKQKLFTLNDNETLCVLFSNPEAMQDIRLYLDKKNYYYNVDNNTVTIKLKSSFDVTLIGV